MDQVDALVLERAGRKLRVAGACIGTDAHTVGIDAIMNMKGYKGDYGLERYRAFETYNLGRKCRSRISCASSRSARSTSCWSRKSSPRKAATCATSRQLAELLEAEGLRDRVLLLAGGPRMTNLLAAELGYDAGFGRGTLPSDVATFIARHAADRLAA